MTTITIPPEALAGAERAYGGCNCPACKKAVRRVAEALLKAWPGVVHYRGGWEPVIHNNRNPHLILPLTETSTKENDNG